MPSVRRGIAEMPYLFHAAGVEHVVISPGSRNAPLIIAFTSHPAIQCHSITDERSAAYFAMGIAQQTRKPVVVLCTSGTALVNFGPALAEAYYLNIPLIAISADRPPEWIDQNDGQTIRQHNLFSNIVKGSFELPVETIKEEDLWLFRRNISEAIHTAKSDVQGPVHINVPLREPLYDPHPEIIEMPGFIDVLPAKKVIATSHLAMLKEKWEKYPKKLIIIGMQPKNPDLSKLIARFLKDKRAVVMAENLANIHCETCIDSPDRLLAFASDQQKQELRPDLLITIGGAVVSKRLKKYFRQCKPAEQWHLGNSKYFIDTFQSLNLVIDTDPEEFLKHALAWESGKREFFDIYQELDQQALQAHHQLLDHVPYSDLDAYKIIFEHLPNNVSLHLANSTPVRYAQLFRPKNKVTYYSNRGTSGIDGCISTAAGAATADQKKHIAIVGDLAFIYDSNAFWNNNLPSNLKVIVIDNNGGNIFKLIDTTPVINPIRDYFETPHRVDLDKLCQAFGLAYFVAEAPEAIAKNIHPFLSVKDKAAVLHIKTPGDVSAKVFKQYYQLISQHNEHEKRVENP